MAIVNGVPLGQYIFMLSIVDISTSDAEPPRSQTSLAYQHLRGAILLGRARPGDKLKINELASQMEISPGAVREALSRLVPEGFVVSRDQRGFIVSPLSIDDLRDLNSLRCSIEEIALRQAVADGNENWEATVLAAAHRLRRTPRLLTGDLPNAEWIPRHEDFHRSLVSGCGSPRLLNLHQQLYHQAERYRNLSLRVEGDRDVEKEHQDLADAALDRDADKLVDLMNKHLTRTTTLLIDAVDLAPEARSA